MHALVLCQRKGGRCSPDNSADVSTNIVPLIESYIKTILGTDDVIIEYLTPGMKGDTEYDADYKFALSKHSHEGRDFIYKHRRYYDLVVMNTCPIGDMELKAVSKILKDDGYLAIKTFQPSNVSGNIFNRDLDNGFNTRMKTRERLLKLFEFARHTFENEDSLFFSKRSKRL